ncbi:hypothetical protein V8C86DRAFT_2851849 [Haematococcus lacustris]
MAPVLTCSSAACRALVAVAAAAATAALVFARCALAWARTVAIASSLAASGAGDSPPRWLPGPGTALGDAAGAEASPAWPASPGAMRLNFFATTAGRAAGRWLGSGPRLLRGRRAGVSGPGSVGSWGAAELRTGVATQSRTDWCSELTLCRTLCNASCSGSRPLCSVGSVAARTSVTGWRTMTWLISSTDWSLMECADSMPEAARARAQASAAVPPP